MKCKHCPREIEQLDSGIWVDADGFAFCAKATLTRRSSTEVEFRSRIDHEPMPDVLNVNR